MASQWRVSSTAWSSIASWASLWALPSTTLYPRSLARTETASTAVAKNGSEISRTMIPSSIVLAPRSPRASGFGR